MDTVPKKKEQIPLGIFVQLLENKSCGKRHQSDHISLDPHLKIYELKQSSETTKRDRSSSAPLKPQEKTAWKCGALKNFSESPRCWTTHIVKIKTPGNNSNRDGCRRFYGRRSHLSGRSQEGTHYKAKKTEI